MKIHSTHPSITGAPIDRQSHRLLAAFGAAALCAMLSTSAHAQSGLFDELSAEPRSQIESASMVQTGLFTHGDETYRVVDTADFRTVADLGSTPADSIAQVGHQSCQSCGTIGGCSGGACGGGACGGVCGGGACGGACGGGACGGGGFGACGLCGMNCGGICNYYHDPCADCVPFYYLTFDALYLAPDGDNRFSLSPVFRMTDFDYETGARITFGSVPNCVDGYEITYTGRFRWDRFGSATSFTGGINSFLVPGGALGPADLSAFQDADFQFQSHVAEYWSVEANKTCIGWDVAKLLYGVRYIDVQEEYAYASVDGAERGLLRASTHNRLIGLQVGMDLLFPLTRHLYSDFRSRFGGFLNVPEHDFLLVNAGLLRAAGSDDTSKLAGMIELGGGLRYQLGQMLSVRLTGELWYLTQTAQAHDQFSPLITEFTGSGTRVNNDIFVTGVTAGIQVRF
jgi:hypothetical protein